MPDANVSDVSMEVVNSESQSPLRRPPLVSFHPTPQSLQRIGEEDEYSEEELEARIENRKNDKESLLIVQMPSQTSSVRIFDESSCVHMSSQFSASEDDTFNDGSAAVTMRPRTVSAKSTLFRGTASPFSSFLLL